MLLVPVETGNALSNVGQTDLTSTSLRKRIRRGTLVVPGQRELIIERCTADVTSTSLQKADLTSGSLRGEEDVTSTCLRRRTECGLCRHSNRWRNSHAALTSVKTAIGISGQT